MGAERKSMLLTRKKRKVTAYHEAGHAIVAALSPHADPLHKVTIIPRGMALGVTMQLPETDKHNYTRDYLETQLAVLMVDASPKRCSLIRCPQAPQMTLSALPTYPARWFASGIVMMVLPYRSHC